MTKFVEWDGDVLKRKKYSLFLTKYLETTKSTTVININGPWGSGKTFFLGKWFDDVSKIHPAIYFNAWQNDYSNDPLLSLISCINSQLAFQNNDEPHKALRKNFLNKSGAIIKNYLLL